MQRIIINKSSVFTMGSVCRVKRFTTGSRNSLEDDRKPQMMWLRQKSKDFYAVGFDAPVKRRDKCISVSGGYLKKQTFVSRSEYHMFYVLYRSVTCLLALPRKNMVSQQ
jgi:hypothetical protein